VLLFATFAKKNYSMLQVSYIRAEKNKTIEGLKKKRLAQAEEKVEQVLATDQSRRESQIERDRILAESNQLAKEIGVLMKSGKKEEAEALKNRTAELKEKSKLLEKSVEELELNLTNLLYQLPNLPHERVPQGQGAEDNFVVSEHGSIPELPQDALPHWDLIKKYDIIDFELGNKVTGAGFPFYKGKGARLQRALVNFFLDEAVKGGYREIQPPHLINTASGYGTGQLPDKEGQMYHIEGYDYYLIPTAEVPLTNMFRDNILNSKELPIKLAGFSQCFRSEAGSWGAHVRGLNRLHQFDKVEIVQIQHPDHSYQALEEMLAHSCSLLEKLELPYRILLLCGGDMSFNAALCYDLEVWSAAQKRWLEVSSVSNFETFQANRLKLRFKDEQNEVRLAHTLNGSALALPRIVAALLENNQQKDHILLPKVLHSYCGFDRID
jgi:seryl-tRNA synthetase